MRASSVGVQWYLLVICLEAIFASKMLVVKLISYLPSAKGIELTFFSGVYGTCVGKYNCYCTELTFSSAAMFKQGAKIKIKSYK